MKRLFISIFSILILPSIFLCAQMPGQSPTSINKPNPNPFPKGAPQKEAPPHPNKTTPKPTAAKEGAGPPFTLPGIVGIRQGQWVGSDNLYNVPPHISIYVEVILPETQKLQTSEKALLTRVETIFTKGGIGINAEHPPGTPPLPLFHVLILFDKIEECLTASCACRLFEAVNIKRAVFDEDITFQAITWEKQDLISAAQADFYLLLDKTIDEFATEFVERFKYFQNLKLQQLQH